MKETTKYLLIGTACVTLGFLLATRACQAQTVCVDPPLLDPTNKELQAEVTELLKQQGITTTGNCDYRLAYYRLAGRVEAPYSNYAVTYNAALPGYVAGEVSVQKPWQETAGWMLALREDGHIVAVYRHSGGNLKREIRRLKRAINGPK